MVEEAAGPVIQDVAPLMYMPGDDAVDEPGVIGEGGPVINEFQGSSKKRPRHRTKSKITCTQCGTEATVGFRPRADRPVYCDPCHQSRKQGLPVRGVQAEIAADSGEATVAE